MKVPDGAEASPLMPEIVVGLLSTGNTADEITEKRPLYLSEGAEKVWTCAADGTMRFFHEDGEMTRSALVPSFPSHVD